jgi:hypothetical protein
MDFVAMIYAKRTTNSGYYMQLHVEHMNFQ